MATTNQYDNAEFNAEEYLAMYPDLADYWNTWAKVNEEAWWHGDPRPYALNHWTNHGKAEGRAGRSTAYQAVVQTALPPVRSTTTPPPAGSAAAAAKKKSGWILWAAVAAGLYLYANRRR